MTTFYYATPEAVAIAWAGALPGLSPSMVDDQLPQDTSTWATSGFITPTIAGGSSEADYRLGSPVVTFQCWAVSPDSSLAPWVKARNISETIRAGTWLNEAVTLPLPECSESACVFSSYAVSEPRRVYGDFGDYAAFSVDVLLNWAPFPQTP